MVIALVVILSILAALQISLAAGAPLGHLAWGGQHRILLTRQRVGSIASVTVYALIAVLALDRTNAIDVAPDQISRVGIWVVFGFFALSIVGNAMSRSRLERLVMVPTTTALAVLTLVVAVN